ncbi:MAG: heparinase II/III family protein [Clostridia bacterium]|nr:heparinase II/III family protein [Clostridia bacterium]
MQSIGSKILAAAKAKNASHPRIIMTKADFAFLRENRHTGLYEKIIDHMIRKADKAIDAPLSEYVIPDGVRLLATSRKVEERILHCAFAYHITGEEKYAARAVREMEAAAAFPDFHPRHFLDCAELVFAFGLCFDWLYDYLTAEQKQLILDRIIDKGFFAILEEYEDAPEHKNVLDSYHGYKWYKDKPGDNWKMVCNGSFGAAIMAIFDEIEYEKLDFILTCGFEDTYEAVRKFYAEDDGTYSEGVAYWSYATRFLSFYSKALITATGSDFGLTDWDGVRRSPYFLFALSSPDYIGFNFGDAGAALVTSPLLSWVAGRYGDEPLYAVRKKDILAGRIDYIDALYFRDVEDQPLKDMPLSFGKVGGDNATFRTDVTKDAIYAGIHFAKNHAYHGHNDMGTFVVNIGDKRFFNDLGPDNYNFKPSYSLCYRYRAEGHNVVVFNHDKGEDQQHTADCQVHRFSDGERSFAIADTSAAYPGKEVVRGLMLDRRDGSITVQDELRCDREDEIRWSAHTSAYTRLLEGGRAAILDIEGTKMYVALLTDGAFALRPSAPDEFSPVVEPAANSSSSVLKGQAENPGCKLVIELNKKTSTRIAVWMYPLTEGREIPTEKPCVTPLALW